MMGKTVTVDIGDSEIRVLTTRGRRVTGWQSLPLPPGTVKDGLVVEPETVGAYLKARLAGQKLFSRVVRASITGLGSISRVIDLPLMPAPLLERAVVREAKREMPVPLESLYLSWQVIEETEDKQKVFILGMPKEIVDTNLEALRRAGLKVRVMDIRTLALARSAQRREAVILGLEPWCYDIILVFQGIPVISRTVIQQLEELSPEEGIEQLAEDISRTVKFFRTSQQNDALGQDTPIQIGGKLASQPAFVKLLARRMDYPVESLRPPLDCPPELPVPQFLVNMGLALKRG